MVSGKIFSITADADLWDVIIGVVEFKKSQFAIYQTLPEILCTYINQLLCWRTKKGKQIKKAIVYGLAANCKEKKVLKYSNEPLHIPSILYVIVIRILYTIVMETMTV